MHRLVFLLIMIWSLPVTASSPPPDFEVFTLWKVGDKATSKDGIEVARTPASELPDDVNRCVIEAAKGWKFPRPTGGGMVKAEYPLVFVPKAEKAE